MKGVCAALLLLSLSAAAAADAQPDAIVVELFMAQGCASCPAADRLLRRLSQKPEWAQRLIPLAYHVDYWNDLGWADVFAAHAWTRRQETYVAALNLGSPYTPQLIINGRKECVGFSEPAIRARLKAAARAPFAARVELAVFPQPKQRALLVHAATTFERLTDQAGFEVWVAVHESGFTTAVRGGENNGRILTNDFVVRALERAGAVRAELGVPQDVAIKIAVPKAWQWERLGVAAFVQHPQTREIEGASRAIIGDSH